MANTTLHAAIDAHKRAADLLEIAIGTLPNTSDSDTPNNAFWAVQQALGASSKAQGLH